MQCDCSRWRIGRLSAQGDCTRCLRYLRLLVIYSVSHVGSGECAVSCPPVSPVAERFASLLRHQAADLLRVCIDQFATLTPWRNTYATGARTLSTLWEL